MRNLFKIINKSNIKNYKDEKRIKLKNFVLVYQNVNNEYSICDMNSFNQEILKMLFVHHNFIPTRVYNICETGGKFFNISIGIKEIDFIINQSSLNKFKLKFNGKKFPCIDIIPIDDILEKDYVKDEFQLKNVYLSTFMVSKLYAYFEYQKEHIIYLQYISETKSLDCISMLNNNLILLYDDLFEDFNDSTDIIKEIVILKTLDMIFQKNDFLDCYHKEIVPLLKKKKK